MGLAACGGKSTPKTSGPGIPSTVTLSPAVATVTRGQTIQFSGSVLDANQANVSNQTISFKSSNTSVLQISSGGLACAGTWDSLTVPVVCTPGPVGTATVTAVSGTLTSSPATVSVHDRVDKVVVSPSNPACISSGHTLQFSARALDPNGNDITSTVGQFQWNSNQGQVVSVDATGTATAAAPGLAGVFASVNTVVSNPISFSTCPVLSISLHTNDAKTAFAIDNAASQQLQADVIDTNGLPLTNAATYLTLIPVNEAVGSTSGGSETFQANTPGTTPIFAACTPPSCNIGVDPNSNKTLSPVYSNVVMATVNGNNITTAFVASLSGTSLLPVDTGNFTAGTAITLPHTPNSMLLSSDGLKGYLGSANGLMIFDITTSTVGTATNLVGTALAVSADDSKVAVFNSDKNLLYVVSASSASALQFPVSGVTAAAFSPDGYKLYAVAGSTLYTYSPFVAFQTQTLSAPANDAAFLTSSALGFLAGGAPSATIGRFTCDRNDQIAVSVPLPAAPQRVASLPAGNGVVLVDNTSIDVVSATVSNNNAVCPPAATASLVKTTNFNIGSFKPRQLLVTPDGTQAFVISDSASVLAYNFASNTTKAIPLAGGAKPTTAGLTLDSAQLWVGGSDNALHLIDLKQLQDIKQVSVSFTPDLVGVRPH